LTAATPLDFIPRLAALVPKPRVHLTRFCGVFAPHSALRAQVTPAGRGKKTNECERSPAERHRAMSWAQRLRRLFRIDIEKRERCGGKVRIIASIEDPAVIGRMLSHLEQREGGEGVAGIVPDGCTGLNLCFESTIRDDRQVRADTPPDVAAPTGSCTRNRRRH
jgi:hypothetical protein